MIIGVTGKIASGKSIVAKRLAELARAEYLDADKIVHELYRFGNQGWAFVRDSFGEEFAPEGSEVDRKKLGELVFGDKTKLSRLEEFIHPLVLEELKDRIGMSGKHGFVIEAFEFERSGLRDLVDWLVFVEASGERIILNARTRGLSVEMVERVLKLQHEPEWIDMRIKNDGDLKSLDKKVDKAFEVLGQPVFVENSQWIQ